MSESFESLESEAILLQAEQLREFGSAVVVALNGPSYAEGELTEDTRIRNEHAGALAIRSGFPLLFVGSRADFNMHKTREQYGRLLDKTPMCADTTSRDSIGNAINARRYVEDGQLRGVGPVTLKYHMPRVVFGFERVLGPEHPVVPCAPEGSPYSLVQNTYLRLAQIPIKFMNRLQLQGFDPTSGEALRLLEQQISSGQRYTGSTKGLSSKILRLLDKATSGKS